jgi:Cu(I)/Ag(I) efflux system membrane fusion protein
MTDEPLESDERASTPLKSAKESSREAPEQDEPPAGARAMAVLRWVLVAVMAVVAALSVAYSFGLAQPNGASTESAQYYCPMHPQVVQDHPGECPICSMSLVLKKSASSTAPMPQAEPSAASHAAHRHNPADPYYCPMHPEETGTSTSDRCPLCEMKLEPNPAAIAPAPRNTEPASKPPSRPVTHAPAAKNAAPLATAVPGLVPVQLELDRVQLIGIKTAQATREPLVAELRATAVVAADESKFARVHARFSGWVEKLAVATTGQKVRRGQTLASIYSPDLLPAQQELLAARKWNTDESMRVQGLATGPGAMADDAQRRLELLGVSGAEIDRIVQAGVPSRTVAITAPTAGHVIRKDVAEGTYVEPGMALFEIADLSKVWMLADVYEHEIGRVRIGQPARVRVESYPDDAFMGKVGFIFPAVDPSTRTVRVRVELANKDFKLRPGMYGNVTIELEKADGIAIPVEALVDTGEHQYVFLAKGAGRFEPRLVRSGPRSRGQVQILEGLIEGDFVVTTANFMIDSESRLRAAIDGAPSP